MTKGQSSAFENDRVQQYTVASQLWLNISWKSKKKKITLEIFRKGLSTVKSKHTHVHPLPLFHSQYVSCPELQDQQYSMDLSSVDSNSRVHPHTKSSLRYIVRPGDPSVPSSSSSYSSSDPHRALTLCKELQSYSSLVSSISSGLEESKSEPGEKGKQRTLVFNNAAHYYLYNRLVDFLSSRDVVSQQMAEVLKVCQQGEVVMIRDVLYRLGVAQLNREDEEEKDRTGEEEEEEGDADAVATDVEVVLE